MDRPKKWILAGIAFLATACIITHQTQLLECASHSLKGIRYILILKGARFKRGDIVAIKGHILAYTPQSNFAKRVLGLPGDVIIQDKGAIHIGAYTLPLMTMSHDGRPLTPLAVKCVPLGYAFVAGDHPRSLDSRYEEFGLVPLNKIWGKGVWAW